MTELPDGWATAPLGELAVNRDRERIPVNAKERAARSGDVPYFGAAGQVGWIDRPLFDASLLLLGEDGVQFFDADKPKAYMITGPSWVNNHAHVLGECRGADLRYLMHFLNQFDYHGYANGTTRLKLTRSSMDEIPVRLAPRSEQERIVVAIEEAFSKLDAGEVGLRTARQLLKRMRDAILAAAVTGRLVPQDPTDTPATKLLADLGVEPIEPEDAPALPGSWAWAVLGSISDSVRNGIFVSRPPEIPPGIPILRIGAVRRLELDMSDIRYAQVDIGDPAVSRAVLAPGDLLFTRYNGNPEFVGACAVVPMTRGPVLHPDKLIRVVARTEVADSNYVAIAVSAGKSRSFIEGVTKTTAGQAGISGGDLKLVPVPVAPLPEQCRIVAEVDRQLSFLGACERAVDAGLARAAATRRSVLKAAFEGKLVPQDPSDEPATVLLERIRGERVAAPKAARRSRRTA